MNIFLSYPSTHRHIAENVCYALQAEGHEVFFDKEDLPPGKSYNERIRSAISNCNLFIFIITPESVAPGKYTLTELKLAIRKWPNPTGYVLPVMLEDTSFDVIPAYLKSSVTILIPEGNITAEIAIEVADLDNTEPSDQTTTEVETEFSVFSYLPLEIRFGSWSEGQYPISVTDSPVGTVLEEPCLFDPKALEVLLQAPTGQINETLRLTQNKHLDKGRVLLPPLADAKKIGEQLYQLLFTSHIQSHLSNSLKLINSQQGQGLRFLINTTETPDLAKLPWEFLYSPKQDDFLFTDIMKPVVRWLDVDQPLSSLAVKPPLRLLIAIASPVNRAELNIGKEIAHLDHALRELVDKGLVEIQRLDHTTLEKLDSALLQYKPHILHFIGHGDFLGNEGMIILETQSSGDADPISGRRLSVLLRNHLDSLRFVFLNSCLGATISAQDPFGGVAQSLIQRGMPAVIAMQFPISDLAAVSLAQHFYRYLAAGLPVDAAITSTRAFMFAKGYDVEWGAPALYMRTPDGKLFDVEISSEQINHYEPLPSDSDLFSSELPQSSSSSPVKWWLILLLACLAVVGSGLWQKYTKNEDPPTPRVHSIVLPAETIEESYQNALVNLKTGNTQEALGSLRATKQKDPNLIWLSNNLEFRRQLISSLTKRIDLELTNGNFNLAQGFANLLYDIDPVLYQQVQIQVYKSKNQENLIKNLTDAVSSSIENREWFDAQKHLNQLIKVAPKASQTVALQVKLTKLIGSIKTQPKHKQVHKVVKGDSLWTIAKSVYGDPSLWSRIYAANQQQIINPNIIFPSQRLILPITSDTSTSELGQNQHQIIKGESLWQIAGKIYGDSKRWPEIYKANQYQIQNPDRIFPKQVIVIPK